MHEDLYNSARSWRIFMKFDILFFFLFFENLSEKLKFHYIVTKITATLHEDLYNSARSWRIFMKFDILMYFF